MKITAFDRFLIVLMALVMTMIAVVIAGVGLGFITIESVNWVAEAIKGNKVNVAISAAFALIVVIVAIRLIVVACGGGRKPAANYVKVSDTVNGSAFIAIATLKQMVKTHCQAYKCITSCECEIIPEEQGLGIKLILSITPTTVIPEFSFDLQTSIKENIEKLSGIFVKYTKILIVPLGQSESSRGSAL